MIGRAFWSVQIGIGGTTATAVGSMLPTHPGPQLATMAVGSVATATAAAAVYHGGMSEAINA